MKKLILSLMFCIVLISLASAAISHLGSFQAEECIELPQICPDCTYNNISSILFPNSTIAIANVVMERDDTYYNYTFCNTTSSGEYKVNGFGDDGGTKTIWNYGFTITSSGVALSESGSGMYIGITFFFLLVSILLFIGFYKAEKWQIKVTYGLFSYVFFVIALNIIDLTVKSLVVNPSLIAFFDSILSVSFIIMWFFIVMVGVIWIITLFQMMLLRQARLKVEKFH